MEKSIGVVGADEKQTRELSTLLRKWQYQVVSINSLSDLKQYVQKSFFQAVMIDLDGLPVAKNYFRDLKEMDSSLNIMGLSSRSFHPELEEAISKHMYACLRKPVDPDELFYLLKSIYQNDALQKNVQKHES